MKTDTALFIIKYTVAVSLLISVLFIKQYLSPHGKEIKRSISEIFINTDTIKINNILSEMTLSDKINQLIIYEPDSIDYSNKDSIISDLLANSVGGIIYNTDSVKIYKQIVDTLNENYKILPYNILRTKFTIPEFTEFPELFSDEAFSMLNDADLKNEIYLKSAELNKKLYADINFPKFNSLNSGSVEITMLSEKFFARKLLVAVDEQSLNKGFYSEKNKQIFESGVSCFVFNDSINSGIRKILKEDIVFKGLKVFDLKNIKSEKYIDTIVSSFKYGADFFISKNRKYTHDIILNALENKLISELEINSSVKRLLAAKFWTGETDTVRQKVSLPDKYFMSELKSMYNKVIEKSACLINNAKKQLPLGKTYNRRIVVITFGTIDLPEFIKHINIYQKILGGFINPKKQNVKNELRKYGKPDILIINVNEINLEPEIVKLIDSVYKKSEKIYVVFKNKQNIKTLKKAKNLIYFTGNTVYDQRFSAELIFGGIGAQSNYIKSLEIRSLVSQKTRLSYGLPEEVKMNAKILQKIDTIALRAISSGVFPGCQITVIKNGNVIYEKSFGYFTYSKENPVNNNDLYDLASVTKIAATTLAVMKMYDSGKLGLDTELSSCFKNRKINYTNAKTDTIVHTDTLLLAEIKDMKKLLQKRDTVMLNDSVVLAYDSLFVSLSPKNNIFRVRIKDLLMHKSGVSPALPVLPYLFYKKNVYGKYDSLKRHNNRNGFSHNDSVFFDKKEIREEIKRNFDKYFSRIYNKDSSRYKIAENFYMKNRYIDTLWENTKALRVYSDKIYQYSDANMILLQMAVDSINKYPINKYLENNFYKPLGMNNTCFQPLNYYAKNKIAPTENDRFWREQQIQGTVHDPTAALLGGVAGNAGLFSTSHDLGIYGQMLLNGGTYGGQTFLKPSTVNLFTSFQEGTHRGLGFDKANKKSITGNGVPAETYGHTGFTGTCIWIDPVNDIVFVFLSNRIYPNQKNWRINTLKIREQIHTVVYESVK